MLKRIWGISATIAMGFLLGFIFAGIGGISAGLKASEAQAKIDANKIEDFWAKSDLDEMDLRSLVNNRSCVLSEKNFLSCVNSVINALTLLQQRLSFNGDILAFSSDTNSLDNYKEKENLIAFAKLYKENLQSTYDFDELWDKILRQATRKIPQKYLLAQGINGYLSVNKDPHTYIMPIEYFDQVSSSSERSPYFVGLSLEKDKGQLRIKKVIKNSDADAAGLQSNDIVLSINGHRADQLNLSDAGQILRDRNIRIFNFNVRRNGISYLKTIQRSYRILSQVYSEIYDVEAHKRVGVIYISKFSKNTCSEVENILSDLANQSISSLVLDLRDNPGGHLSEASCLAGLFIGVNKKIYSVQYFDLSKSREVVLTNSEKIYSGPLAVLVNTNSASASELFAGAIQEYKRGIIIGTKTFGKGTFQEVEMWKDTQSVGYFKTKGFYLLPSGQSTQFYGVKPDLEIDDGKVLPSREELNYLNPIMPQPEFALKNMHAELPLQKCENKITKHFEISDIVLTKAIETLRCSELMTYIASQFTGSDFN
ncbi:MAG: S41 family peptidase [Pseudobdellovibrio sp.]